VEVQEIEHRELPRLWELPPQRVIEDGLRRIRGSGTVYKVMLLISAVCAIVGIIAFIVGPISSGWNDRQAWTYVAITFGILMCTIGSAPCFSVCLRMVRGHWRRPVNRLAEIWAIGMIVPLILFFFLLGILPDTVGRSSFWFGWPVSPYLWDSVMMVALVICGYGFLYVGALPDMAIARDQIEGEGGGIFTRLSRGFRGTLYDWQIIDRAQGILGAFYVLLYVGSMTVIAGDFIEALVPGDNSAIFPAQYTIEGLEAGIAVTIFAMGIMRYLGGLDEYLEAEQFFAAAKLQLALGLLYFYTHWTEFIIWWYGRTPREVALLKIFYFEPYFWLFCVAFATMFLSPLFILVWTRVRMGIVGPWVTSGLVLVGIIIDNIRLYSASFSTPNIYLQELSTIPKAYVPGVTDILLAVGLLGGAVGVCLLGFKLVPYPSIWEVTAGIYLRVRRKYLKTEVVLIGKPN